MRSLQDAVYNWLTIKLVADNRPEDQAALDTTTFFRELLTEEHNVIDIHVQRKEEMYFVTCKLEKGERNFRFPTELIDCIYDQMEQNPERYQNYPI